TAPAGLEHEFAPFPHQSGAERIGGCLVVHVDPAADGLGLGRIIYDEITASRQAGNGGQGGQEGQNGGRRGIADHGPVLVRAGGGRRRISDLSLSLITSRLFPYRPSWKSGKAHGMGSKRPFPYCSRRSP